MAASIRHPSQTIPRFQLSFFFVILVTVVVMSRKRNIANLHGSSSPPKKRSHVDSTDIENGKVFFVLSGNCGIPAIFLDEKEAKLYSNGDSTSIIAFRTFEDAKQYVQEAVAQANEKATQTENERTESAILPRNDVTKHNATPTNDVNKAFSVNEPTSGEKCDEIKRQSVSVAEGTELAAGQVLAPSDHITVFVSSTIAKAKGQVPRMAYAVYFEQNSPHNISEAIAGQVSTQRAELMAVLEAVKAIAVVRGKSVTADGHVELRLTSSYVKNGVVNWMPRWKKAGWRNANKGPLKNADLWQELDALLQEFGRDRITMAVTSSSESMESFTAGRLAERALRESS